MKQYQIITRCGVTVLVEAMNAYQASNQARNDGWSVLYIAPLLVK